MQAEGEVHALQKKMQQLEREIAVLNQQIKSADTMEDPESIELIEMQNRSKKFLDHRGAARIKNIPVEIFK